MGVSALLGIAHVSLVIEQMERSLAFYRDLLGMEVTGDDEVAGEYVSTVSGLPGARVRIVLLSAGDAVARLELLEFRVPRATTTPSSFPAVGTPHIALWTSDIHALHALLAQAGVVVVSPPVSDGTQWALHAFDPDGIRVELMQRVTD